METGAGGEDLETRWIFRDADADLDGHFRCWAHAESREGSTGHDRRWKGTRVEREKRKSLALERAKTRVLLLSVWTMHGNHKFDRNHLLMLAHSRPPSRPYTPAHDHYSPSPPPHPNMGVVVIDLPNGS